MPSKQSLQPLPGNLVPFLLLFEGSGSFNKHKNDYLYFPTPTLRRKSSQYTPSVLTVLVLLQKTSRFIVKPSICLSVRLCSHRIHRCSQICGCCGTFAHNQRPVTWHARWNFWIHLIYLMHPSGKGARERVWNRRQSPLVEPARCVLLVKGATLATHQRPEASCHAPRHWNPHQSQSGVKRKRVVRWK